MPGTCTVTIGSDSWSVSLASTYEEIISGLAGQISLGAGTGVLFDMGAVQYITVTTQNMLFNIDIAFIDAYGVITSIHRDVAPGNLISGYGRSWLEVNAGELAGVEVGDTTVITCIGALEEEEPPGEWEGLMSSLVGLVMMIMVVDMGYNMFKEPLKKAYKDIRKGGK